MGVKQTIAIGSLAALIALAGGCCRPARPQQVIFALAKNAIFNPADSPAPLMDFDRADWPSTYGSDTLADETQFHERIIDIQGRNFDNNDDYLYRRFDSSRYGRSRR